MTVAASLWVFAVLRWIILIYTFFASVTVAEPKPSLEVAFFLGLKGKNWANLAARVGAGSLFLFSREICLIRKIQFDHGAT